jgi:MarR family 2-MHQ and catechol resistance regulon transcriptional repressor
MLHNEVMMKGMDDIQNVSSGGLWIVLARSFRSVQTLVERSIESLDIGLSDFMILEALLHVGPLTLSQLCHRVLLANTSMTSAADRLEKKNLIRRVEGFAGDRRTRMMNLTPEGEEFIKPLFERHIKDIDAVMAGIPSTDRTEARRVLRALGTAAEDQLKKMDEKPKAKTKAKAKKEQ